MLSDTGDMSGESTSLASCDLVCTNLSLLKLFQLCGKHS